jgi:hypothetical protein
MKKFNLQNLIPKMKEVGKQVGKNAGTDALNVAVIMGGALGSQKFLDLTRVLKNLPPDHWAIKFQGFVKAGLGILSLMFFSHKMPGIVRMLIYGIVFQGMLSGARSLSADPSKSFFEAIGRGEDLPITEQYRPGVAGPGERQTLLENNASSAVAGPIALGFADSYDNEGY